MKQQSATRTIERIKQKLEKDFLPDLYNMTRSLTNTLAKYLVVGSFLLLLFSLNVVSVAGAEWLNVSATEESMNILYGFSLTSILIMSLIYRAELTFDLNNWRAKRKNLSEQLGPIENSYMRTLLTEHQTYGEMKKIADQLLELGSFRSALENKIMDREICLNQKDIYNWDEDQILIRLRREYKELCERDGMDAKQEELSQLLMKEGSADFQSKFLELRRYVEERIDVVFQWRRGLYQSVFVLSILSILVSTYFWFWLDRPVS